MMLIKFEGKHGDKIYINPEKIKYVMNDVGTFGNTTIGFDGSAIYVKGCPEEVIGKIEQHMHQHIVASC